MLKNISSYMRNIVFYFSKASYKILHLDSLYFIRIGINFLILFFRVLGSPSKLNPSIFDTVYFSDILVLFKLHNIDNNQDPLRCVDVTHLAYLQAFFFFLENHVRFLGV